MKGIFKFRILIGILIEEFQSDYSYLKFKICSFYFEAES